MGYESPGQDAFYTWLTQRNTLGFIKPLVDLKSGGNTQPVECITCGCLIANMLKHRKVCAMPTSEEIEQVQAERK